MIVNSFEKDITQEKLIENFKKQLNLYKKSDGNYTLKELKQVEDQADKLKIENENGKFDEPQGANILS